MHSDRWHSIERLFQGALALDQAARRAYLDRECGSDLSLRAEIEGLLRQDASAVDRVEDCVGRAVQDLLETQIGALVGRRMGAWRLGEQIAHGGMGAVYLAERADGHFEQRAALKVLNPALLSAEALGRFNAERQILARLNHPNIARLIDGGTTEDGIPYLVMEYIEGTAIDHYCADHALEMTARLRLMQKLCAAIDYAHKNLVVHRDIKPSNVLVDGDGEPKLLDFGVAKLVAGENSLAASPVTVADLRALTPRYASPEQIRGETITTASDVYSVGLLLYELLAGRSPYPDTDRSPAELSRAICETEPERPSTAVRHAADAASRNLSRRLAGDLDNIVLVALRKEPARRYASALQLAEDIERHLRDEPVLARPSRLAYRARKFLVRHRVGVLGSAVAATLLVAIIAVYGVELAVQRDQARAEAAKATAVSRFLTDLFREADPNSGLGKNVTARALLQRGAARITRQLKRAPRIQAALMGAIGQSFANMADYSSALQQTDAALAIERGLGPREVHTVNHLELERGRLLGQLGHYGRARAQLQAVHHYDLSHYGEHSREVADGLRALAQVDFATSRFASAQREYETAIADLRALGAPGRADLAIVLERYGHMEARVGNFHTAEAALDESLALTRAVYGPDQPQLITVLDAIGGDYVSKGDVGASLPYFNKSLALSQELYGSDDLNTAKILANRGSAEYVAGQYHAAERDSRAALGVFRRVLGNDEAPVVFLRDNIANALLGEQRYAEGLAIFRRDLASLRHIFGPQNVEVGLTLENMGGALNGLGRFQQADQALQQSARIMGKGLGRLSYPMIILQTVRADTDAGLGHRTVAESELRHAIANLRRVDKGGPDGEVAQSLTDLGRMLLSDHQPGEAVRALRSSVREWARVTGPAGSDGAAETRAELGRALLAGGHTRAGISELADAHTWLQAHLGSRDPIVRRLMTELTAARARAHVHSRPTLPHSGKLRTGHLRTEPIEEAAVEISI